jgi:DNA polymerase
MTLSRSTRSSRLRAVEDQASRCTRCELYENATQTVFGAGRPTARLMLVGEQPGDKEDRQGEPFVGPAGTLLDRALADLAVDRKTVYLTNVVKHFRFEQVGKRRIHKTPSIEHVRICLPWFEQELAIVQPDVVVCLGAVAAKALVGPKFKLTEHRGEFVPWERPGRLLATVHPSSVLRSDDRTAAYAAFRSDLAVAVDATAKLRASA